MGSRRAFATPGSRRSSGIVDGFVDAAQEFQYRALKFQIETLRWEPAISGYVITELNDVQWESNGLMDVRNRPRAFAERLANLQQPWLVIARAPRTAIRPGERVEVAVRLAGAGAAAARRAPDVALWRTKRQRCDRRSAANDHVVGRSGRGDRHCPA